jgi:hypothetical protein
MALVGDWLTDIEQQKIDEEDVRVGSERFRLPSRMSQLAKVSFRRCRNSGCSCSRIANGLC